MPKPTIRVDWRESTRVSSTGVIIGTRIHVDLYYKYLNFVYTDVGVAEPIACDTKEEYLRSNDFKNFITKAESRMNYYIREVMAACEEK